MHGILQMQRNVADVDLLDLDQKGESEQVNPYHQTRFLSILLQLLWGLSIIDFFIGFSR